MTLTTGPAAEIETIEPEELREGARRFLADKVDRRAAWGENATPDTGALRGNMTELGWLMLTAPTTNGGLGQSFAALAPIYEEMGRALSPVTIADTMAAIDVLAAAGGAPASALLERIVAGDARVVLLPVPGSSGTADVTAATVPDAQAATTALLLPDGSGGTVSLVELDQAGATVEPVATWDRTRSFGDIRLTAVSSTPIAIDGAEALRIARAHGDLAIAWDCVGAARQALDEAVAYMATRQQFNRPIGSFQALKHRAADLKVGMEIARALTVRASAVFAERAPDWSDLAGQARLLAVDAFRAIAEESVQFHGGIGFTWEQDSHLFLKRALMNEMLGGSPEQVRDRLAPGIMTRALAGR